MNYIRNNTRLLSSYKIKDLFNDGTFNNEGNEEFSKEDLELFVKNLRSGLPCPYFAAREDEYGNVHFKSAKLLQVVNFILESDFINSLTQFEQRRIKNTSIHFATVSEDPMYNPGITQEVIKQAFNFYL